MTQIKDRFLSYVRMNTQSADTDKVSPSTECQFAFARLLAAQLTQMGVEDAVCDEKCYVYAHIEASEGYESAIPVGFVAHIDTAPDFSGDGVTPVLHENYDGKDVTLLSGRVLSVEDFPHLKSLAGRTLITSDGSTLLGSDDKAGIAEIMYIAERLMRGDIPHGRVCIAFTPDEEIGAGTAGFDKEKFGAVAAYTLDGSAEGEIEYENFNAASAKITVYGNNVHPGSAKGIMKNAASIAAEIDTMLPKAERPQSTEGYEGFYHLLSMTANVERAEMSYILRDHDREKLEEKKRTVEDVVSEMNKRYGEGPVRAAISDSYRNMAEILTSKENQYVLDIANEAIRNLGITPVSHPIRGGTDGATISFMGIPCPNLGTGGYAFHGPYEHCTVEGMQKAADIALEIVKIYAERATE